MQKKEEKGKEKIIDPNEIQLRNWLISPEFEIFLRYSKKYIINITEEERQIRKTDSQKADNKFWQSVGIENLIDSLERKKKIHEGDIRKLK